jgi:hypothetical protein
MQDKKNHNLKYSHYLMNKSDNGKVVKNMNKIANTNAKISKEAAFVYQTKYEHVKKHYKHMDQKHMKKSLLKNTSAGKLYTDKLFHGTSSPRSKNYLNIHTKSSAKQTQASSGEKPEITPLKLMCLNSEDDSCDNLEVPTGKFN